MLSTKAVHQYSSFAETTKPEKVVNTLRKKKQKNNAKNIAPVNRLRKISQANFQKKIHHAHKHSNAKNNKSFAQKTVKQKIAC